MPTLATVMNIGRTSESVGGAPLALNEKAVFDLDDEAVQLDLRNDPDLLVLGLGDLTLGPAGLTQEEQAILTAFGNTPFQAAVTVPAEVANAKTVSVQLEDAAGNNVSDVRAVGVYLSSDAAGLEPVDLGADDVIPSEGANGQILTGADAASEEISEIRVLSEFDGTFDLVFTNASDQAKTRYFWVLTAAGRSGGNILVWVDDTP